MVRDYMVFSSSESRVIQDPDCRIHVENNPISKIERNSKATVQGLQREISAVQMQEGGTVH